MLAYLRGSNNCFYALWFRNERCENAEDSMDWLGALFVPLVQMDRKPANGVSF